MFICSLILLLNILLPLLFTHITDKPRSQRTPLFPELCSLNCTRETYCFIIFFLLCLLLWEGKMTWGVCPLGYRVPFSDLLFGSMLTGYESCTDLGKNFPSKKICLYVSSFLLFSRCAKSLSSLVKWFLLKCQNLTYSFGISIASVIQSTCMTAEPAVLKGRHPIWIDSEEMIQSAEVCSVLMSLFSFINLSSPKVQETQVQ